MWVCVESLAYDDIEWLEFATNMVLPVSAATLINCAMMFIYYGAELYSLVLQDSLRMWVL